MPVIIFTRIDFIEPPNISVKQAYLALDILVSFRRNSGRAAAAARVEGVISERAKVVQEGDGLGRTIEGAWLKVVRFTDHSEARSERKKCAVAGTFYPHLL